MLERIFGMGRVVVRVKAELDFHYEELREKRSEPVVGSKGVVISEETRSETYRGTGGVAGVPGVASNVPGYVAIQGAEGESEYEKQEVTRNYEISVSEKYQVKAPGELRKLSVAVWVDGDLAEEDREQLVAMVSSAVGVRPERGDVVQIASMPFATDFATPVAGTAEVTVLGLGDWRVLLALGLLIVLIIVLAMRRRRAEPEESVELPPPMDEEEDLEMLERELTPDEQQRLRIRRQVERMAEEDPEGLARLLRAWMAED